MSKADRLKYSEIKVMAGSLPVSFGGARPHNVKRKRSFWRALKRGECWAIMDYKTRELIKDVNRQMYDNAICDCNATSGLIYLLRGEK